MGKTIWVNGCVFLCFLLCPALHAQTEAATLRGSVRDASQAVVASAAVKLTNIDQNRTWSATSNAAGAYDIEQIPPGRYALRVEANGFKRYQRPALTLQANQIADIDVTLEVGAVTETVEVQAEAPLLESANSSLGEVVNHLTTVALPLNGRNVMQLDYRSHNTYTIKVSSILCFHRNTTGSALISS
ncbi:MAG: carboxypeptidase-like regulatory domain-containing protein, partial [Bryobacteraceae bacterium]